MKHGIQKTIASAFIFASLLSGLFHASLRADDRTPIPGVATFEGAYDRQGTGCTYAAQATLSEDTDPATDLVTYHLRLLREDGRVWNSREFRQLNGLPWYKADAGNDGTVSGRSRYGCTGPDCTLWNERKTCTGLVFPRCTPWTSTRQDELVFEGSTLTLYTDTDGICTYLKR